jgi:hypothetical protein
MIDKFTEIGNTHLAFSDDSKYGNKRFNSLSLITVPTNMENSLRDQLNKIFEILGIQKEFKWEKVRNKKYRQAAERIFEFVFQYMNCLRVDVLTWDILDSRHSGINGRDDDKNMGYMYYHLLQNILCKRWDTDSKWLWLPDHQSSMDWKTLHSCLISKKHKIFSDLFNVSEHDFLNLGLIAIQPTESHKEVFIQIADCFAGLAAFSYGQFEAYLQWELDQSRQASLFSKLLNNHILTESENEKMSALSYFIQNCKLRKLPISLKSSKGLKTHKPSSSINFWLYTPQHVLDKAPINTKRLATIPFK